MELSPNPFLIPGSSHKFSAIVSDCLLIPPCGYQQWYILFIPDYSCLLLKSLNGFFLPTIISKNHAKASMIWYQ